CREIGRAFFEPDVKAEHDARDVELLEPADDLIRRGGRNAAEHGTFDAEREQRLNAFERAQAAADLKTCFAGLRECGNDRAVRLLAVLRAVEIDDVHVLRAPRDVAIKDHRRIVGVYRFRCEIALIQAYAAASLEVDGGNELHQSLKKLRRSRAPT